MVVAVPSFGPPLLPLNQDNLTSLMKLWILSCTGKFYSKMSRCSKHNKNYKMLRRLNVFARHCKVVHYIGPWPNSHITCSMKISVSYLHNRLRLRPKAKRVRGNCMFIFIFQSSNSSTSKLPLKQFNWIFTCVRDLCNKKAYMVVFPGKGLWIKPFFRMKFKIMTILVSWVLEIQEHNESIHGILTTST